MNKNFLKQAKTFLRKQEVKILETSQDGFLTLLHKHRLESIPKRPQLYVNWKNIELLVFISNKDELFHAKDGNDKTGGDWSTFQFLEYIQGITGKDIILLIHEKESNEWFIRQLNQLPKPQLGWRDRCLAFQYKRKEEYWNCAKCWRNNPYTTRQCMHKIQPTALWNSDEFSNKILIQKNLWQLLSDARVVGK